MKITYLITITAILSIAGCKTDNVQGIIIGATLKTNQTVIENHTLENLIIRSLHKDKDSLVALKDFDFDCGGGSGCYDLGHIITQIIFRIGEEEFVTIYQRMSETEKSGFSNLISAGLEYGGYGEIGHTPEIKEAFPKLNMLIQ